MRKMKDIYVPIEISDLSKLLPPGERVIYSTICSISYSVENTTKEVYGTVKRSFVPEFKSHVLITTKGLAYHFRPSVILGKEIMLLEREPRYNTLLNVYYIKGKRFRVSDIGQKYLTFDLITQANIESIKTYNERIKKFKMTLIPHILNTTQLFLTYVLDNKDKQEKDDSPLWKINKNFFKYNFIDLNYDQIPNGEDLERMFEIINDKKVKKKLFNDISWKIKKILQKVHKVAYVDYERILKRRQIKTFLMLYGRNFSIFNNSNSTIKYLQKDLLRWNKRLDKEKKKIIKIDEKTQALIKNLSRLYRPLFYHRPQFRSQRHHRKYRRRTFQLTPDSTEPLRISLLCLF